MVNKKLSKETESYIRELIKTSGINGKQKKIFISDITECIEDYASENPDCTIEDIKIRFGTGEEIAKGFSDIGNIGVVSRINIKKLVLSAVIIALIIWLAFAVISFIDVHNEAHGFFTEGLLFITEKWEGFV